MESGTRLAILSNHQYLILDHAIPGSCSQTRMVETSMRNQCIFVLHQVVWFRQNIPRLELESRYRKAPKPSLPGELTLCFHMDLTSKLDTFKQITTRTARRITKDEDCRARNARRSCTYNL